MLHSHLAPYIIVKVEDTSGRFCDFVCRGVSRNEVVPKFIIFKFEGFACFVVLEAIDVGYILNLEGGRKAIVQRAVEEQKRVLEAAGHGGRLRDNEWYT